jgi:hypothetical protein
MVGFHALSGILEAVQVERFRCGRPPLILPRTAESLPVRFASCAFGYV